jgi:hypothetical protein
MTTADFLAKKTEENAEKIWRAYQRGLDSESEAVAYRAAEALMSRTYGRPTERVETEDKSVDLRSRTREELEAELERLAPHLVREDLAR